MGGECSTYGTDPKCKSLLGEIQGEERPLGGDSHICETIIKTDWINVALDGDWYRAVVGTVLINQVSQNASSILATISI
jgi:hypothetical protein